MSPDVLFQITDHSLDLDAHCVFYVLAASASQAIDRYMNFLASARTGHTNLTVKYLGDLIK